MSFIKGLKKLIFLLTFPIIFSFSSAFAIYIPNLDTVWRPVISLGVGKASTDNLGKSKVFPIINPDTDELYVYFADDTTHFSTFYDVFVGAEWCFCPPWSAQLGIGYNRFATFSVRSSFSQGADAASTDFYNYHYDVKSSQTMLEGKILYTMRRFIHPYVFAGIGESSNKAEHYETNIPIFLTFTRNYANHTETGFSYALGVGIDADICDHLRLGVGYRFNDVGKIRLGRATIDTTPVNGRLSQPHLYINELLAQLTFVL